VLAHLYETSHKPLGKEQMYETGRCILWCSSPTKRSSRETQEHRKWGVL